MNDLEVFRNVFVIVFAVMVAVMVVEGPTWPRGKGGV